MLRWTKARVPALHTWPAWKKTPHRTPSTAKSRSTSSSTIDGDFPPSSSVQRLIVPLASCMIRRPTSVEPVKAILSTRGETTSSSPAAAPGPDSTLTTPSGIPASRQIRPTINEESGVYEAGFRITVLPAAIAGAIFHAAIWSGKFHGVIAAHTPIGSRRRELYEIGEGGGGPPAPPPPAISPYTPNVEMAM